MDLIKDINEYSSDTPIIADINESEKPKRKSRTKKADKSEPAADVNEYDGEIIAEEDNAVENEAYNIRAFKIISKGNGYIGVSFEGFGIKIKTDSDYILGGTADISYQGKIGTKNFKYRLV
jgi:hypothetical protein